MKCGKRMAGVISTLLISTPASAGEFSGKLGALGIFSADYEGSDGYKGNGFPFLSLGWAADAVVPKGGTGLQLGLHDVSFRLPGVIDFGLAKLYRPEGQYKANLGVTYGMGRDQDDNSALNGMGNIDKHALGTARFSFKPDDSGWTYGITYTGDLSDETGGATVDGKIGYTQPISKRLIASVSSTVTWANEDHMQSYFGVSGTQATTSSNARFEADSGIKSAAIGLGLNWMITETWVATSSLGYSRLLNDAADSPLVKTSGSPDQYTAKLGLLYAF